MERYRVRASCNTASLSPNPNHFLHSSKPAAHINPLPPKPTPPHPISPELTTSLSRRIVDDTDAEISIFDAERYFNAGGEGGDVDNTLKTLNILNGTEDFVCNPGDSSLSSAASSVDGGGNGRIGHSRARSFRASTPTAPSEASWNSQTGLLAANAPGDSVAVTVRAYPSIESTKKGSIGSNGTSGSSFRGRRFFGLHCPCYGKKSVAVEDKFSESRSSIRSSLPKPDVDVSSNSSSSSNKEAMEMMSTKVKIRATDRIVRRVVYPGVSSFSFPVPPPLAATEELELSEPARESLEVFRPSELLRMAAVGDDDVASDTSSDLFELESFSAGPTAVCRRRDSLDELPRLASTAGLPLRRGSEDSVAPGGCYAPSEASVEWSVTTAEPGLDRASVANFSSAASDCGGAEKGRFDSSAAAAVTAGKEGGGVKKRGGGVLLMNCRSEKAVSVGPKPVRVGPD